MTDDEFRARCTAEGWAEPRTMTYEPDQRPDLHTHDFDAMVLMLSGSMTLASPGGDQPLTPGQVGLVPAGTVHSEHGGPQGGQALLATRPA